MSRANICLDQLSDMERQQFKRLIKAPLLSRPIMVLWLLLMLTFFSVYTLGFAGAMPLWWGAVINALVGYLAFSIVHDAIHRSISSSQKWNDFLGQTAVLLIAPYVNLRLFRWGAYSASSFCQW